MRIEDALYSRLSGYAGLTALTSNRLYPGSAPKGAAIPYVVFRRISEPRIHAMGSDPGLVHPRWEFGCWDDDYRGAGAVADQIVAALNHFSGTMGGAGGVTVSAAWVENRTDLYNADTGLSGVAVDVEIWHFE